MTCGTNPRCDHPDTVACQDCSEPIVVSERNERRCPACNAALCDGCYDQHLAGSPCREVKAS